MRKPDTSKEAYEHIKPKVYPVQRKILAALMRRDAGATSQELADLLRMPFGTVQPRTTELRDRKFIVDSGERRVSRVSGRNQIVWRLHSRRRHVR